MSVPRKGERAVDHRAVLSALIIVGLAVLFGVLGTPAEMGLGIVASGLAAAFINIDKMQRFKGGGFEAEMREAVDEAYATIETLRQLAKTFISSTLHNLTMAGRFDGLGMQEKHAVREELRELAEQLGIEDDAELKAAHQRFFEYHAWDHFSSFVDELSRGKAVAENVLKELTQMRRRGQRLCPSRGEIEAALGDDVDKLRDEDRERLEDYLYYMEEGRLRRPEGQRD